jgi:ribosomal protein L37E
MPACEKCWADSRVFDVLSTYGPYAYSYLVEQRDATGNACTPHEQAGPDATECQRCHRMTVHQHAKVCMTCGWSPADPEKGR